jgi:uncharacterized protein YndB with AHSA1/START domain
VIAFETDVRIDRPVGEVFAYVSEPLNFPRWSSAVETVRKSSAGDGGVGPRYVMERELPTGRAINELDVVASEPLREFAIRATTGPTPFLYRYRFAAANGETSVHLDAEVELPGSAGFLSSLARRAVKNGVDQNLATLKQILEATRSGVPPLADGCDRSAPKMLPSSVVHGGNAERDVGGRRSLRCPGGGQTRIGSLRGPARRLSWLVR